MVTTASILPSSVAKDAKFLLEQQGGSRRGGSGDDATQGMDSNDITSASVIETSMGLHRSNMLRLQIQELLDECHIKELSSTKWALSAHEYLETVSNIITSEVPSFHCNKKASSKNLSDKPVIIDWENKKSSNGSDDEENSDNDNDSDPLIVTPIGCTKSPIGWTKSSGNAKQLPTFTLMVQLPTSIFSSKDYLHYRYFDVSFVWVCMVCSSYVVGCPFVGFSLASLFLY